MMIADWVIIIAGIISIITFCVMMYQSIANEPDRRLSAITEFFLFVCFIVGLLVLDAFIRSDLATQPRSHRILWGLANFVAAILWGIRLLKRRNR